MSDIMQAEKSWVSLTLVAQGGPVIFFFPQSFSSGLARGTYKTFSHGYENVWLMGRFEKFEV